MTHQLSQVTTSCDLTVIAGTNLNLTGTQVAVGTGGKGSGIIAAGGAINIAAVTNEVNSSQQNDPSSKAHDKRIYQNETVIGSGVTAAGSLAVQAGTSGAGSLNIVASSLGAGEALRVSAANDVNVVSAQERHLSDTASTRSSSNLLRSKTTQQADYGAWYVHASYGRRSELYFGFYHQAKPLGHFLARLVF